MKRKKKLIVLFLLFFQVFTISLTQFTHASRLGCWMWKRKSELKTIFIKTPGSKQNNYFSFLFLLFLPVLVWFDLTLLFSWLYSFRTYTCFIFRGGARNLQKIPWECMIQHIKRKPVYKQIDICGWFLYYISIVIYSFEFRYFIITIA